MTVASESADVAAVVGVAEASACALADSTIAERARWLRALGASLREDREALVAQAHDETHLSTSRLTGEVERTAMQLEFMATVIEEGSYLEATLDSPDATLIPPRPDLRRMLRPIGPVAVYAASNFPFAFSVLGNDTSSALAAGCPVVVKAHPGHPVLSARVTALASAALQEAGAPEGAFGTVYGLEAGVELIAAPAIRAAGFTGAVRSGRLLYDLASARPDPIPFYGELGSINPVFVTERAADERAAQIAAGFADSFTRDGGQYCTKPGILFHPASGASAFEAALAEAVSAKAAQQLLTASIADSYRTVAAGIRTTSEAHAGLTTILTGPAGTAAEVPVSIVSIGLSEFLASPESYLEECFGPFAVIVRYQPGDDLAGVVPYLPGSLTATFHTVDDEPLPSFAAILQTKVGRMIRNGWPTGVAVAWAQHHGGPWSSTTNSIHTSVGASGIRRWLTPIAFQDFAEEWLPPALRRDNPLGIPRRVDGKLDLGRAIERTA